MKKILPLFLCLLLMLPLSARAEESAQIPDTEGTPEPSVTEHTHTWSEVTVAATCTQAGSVTRTCGCGETVVETIPATGHSWDEGVVTQKPTDETEGEKTFTCEFCGETKTESIPLLEHTHKYSSVVTAPTCAERGYTTYTCACGDSYVWDLTLPLGHSFGEWTMHDDKQHKRMCACGETELADHIYDNDADASCNDCEATREIVIETTDNSNTNSDSEKSGCGSTISSGFVMIFWIVGMGCTVLRKRKV